MPVSFRSSFRDMIIPASGNKCGPAEYKSNTGQCCPMCGKGLVVRKDCTLESSTSCIPCTGQTYMNAANGLAKCFPCSPCDPGIMRDPNIFGAHNISGQGLFILMTCTSTSNSICHVQNGYYCTSSSAGNECTFALRHTLCSPGQRVKVPGTKTTDTMCEECQHGSYSQHGVNCTAWTDCESIGQYKIEDGSQTRDVVCRKSLRNRVIVLVPSSVFLFVVIIFVLSVTKENQPSPKLPVEETGFQTFTSGGRRAS
ncbi:tumor necrosis factor receptor superfamily member 14 isoform X2 [Salmo salar]|uniref:Tumor necrosis factor receptor superfamily member 14 isoform X2 n=1 Tax=Salmo salar TaxID=8030 RepID=A0A1S3MHV0_SALSA|nr:tumor necrosis factor receptor superfamily member 14 isoform X2 [Salmo salar]|eukprot:XP_014002767.1 PREDICTED: tumor necrosis factor receptor superfamily member 14 isoform X2 [Salmo salar]